MVRWLAFTEPWCAGWFLLSEGVLAGLVVGGWWLVAENLRKSTKIVENLRKSTKIDGNLRKSTKIDENLRTSRKIYENL